MDISPCWAAKALLIYFIITQFERWSQQQKDTDGFDTHQLINELFPAEWLPINMTLIFFLGGSNFRPRLSPIATKPEMGERFRSATQGNRNHYQYTCIYTVFLLYVHVCAWVSMYRWLNKFAATLKSFSWDFIWYQCDAFKHNSIILKKGLSKFHHSYFNIWNESIWKKTIPYFNI